ncbi:hypothetical protein CDAR_167521 [Caerostris darwini]|uniref:Uncharacterized protein n=1 Tax=Caerostris darwini TaxID=1538125 RepID=A0AAV4NH10_9ARAC|nr:hypothetical protein CDAR_167521 [Caerostris darwini]
MFIPNNSSARCSGVSLGAIRIQFGDPQSPWQQTLFAVVRRLNGQRGFSKIFLAKQSELARVPTVRRDSKKAIWYKDIAMLIPNNSSAHCSGVSLGAIRIQFGDPQSPWQQTLFAVVRKLNGQRGFSKIFLAKQSELARVPTVRVARR